MNRRHLTLRLWVCILLAVFAAAARFLLPFGDSLSFRAEQAVLRDTDYVTVYSSLRSAALDAADKLAGLFSGDEGETIP